MKKILSIDGGGIKGIFAAKFLAEIEEKCGVKLNEYFDLIAGTSTGGIIAAALAYGIPAKKILQLYMEKGQEIFPNRKKTGVFKAKYKTEPLKKALEEVFGSACIKDCQTRLLIPTYNLESDKVRVFKTPHSPDLYFDKDLRLVDCILATTAAPLYFKPHKMQGGVYIDGGVGANNPSLIALIEGITRCKWNAEDIAMLSIGGVCELGQNTGTESMGIVDGLKIQKCFMSAESQYAHNICNIVLENEQYIRVSRCVPVKRFGLDKADVLSMKTLSDYGQIEAMNYITTIKNMFMAQKIEKVNLYNI